MNLTNLTREEMRQWIVTLGEKPYRGDQVFRWVQGRGVHDLEAMTDLAKPLRERLRAEITTAPLALDAMQLSQDGTRKLRLKTHEGRFIESVLIPDSGGAGDEATDQDEEEGDTPAALAPRRPKLTQCISSQVGCALDCRFCATALLGFGRQLTAGEIVAQVQHARSLVASLPAEDPTRRAGADHLTNIVFMGMGEPLHNLHEVERAIAILTDPLGPNLSPRRITVSTAGLVPGITRFAEVPPVRRPNLAVSLNATTDEVRDEIMPINRKWKIADLLAAVRAFPLERRRRVTFEYVLLAGVNDTIEDAHRLPQLLRGIPCKVNLIPWNPHPQAPYRRPEQRVIQRFQEELRRGGLAVYLRRPRGDDIDAACGQLAARGEDHQPLVTLRSR
ncbi:MAG TPA: 23S rRNA (adenine(2503)-C(2))-methyltransferase RlmN [Polyangia bacterium]|nr:23S rRNA (adenine(2503)-C(2))-methyltransferase RlmN [Polyangia bacterium]